MTGVEFGFYAESFKKWLGADLAPPQIGFPVEYQYGLRAGGWSGLPPPFGLVGRMPQWVTP
jgi:hypothetical protein